MTIHFLAPFLDVIVALILVFSAYFLSKKLQKSTGNRQKTFLFILHIINLCLYIVLLVLKGVIWKKWMAATSEEEKSKFYMRYTLIKLFSDIVGIYVDFFLLWLLYKFMKPKTILRDGRTSTSAILFAHDSKTGSQILLE